MPRAGAGTQLCCRVCLLPGAVGMGELDTNGCAKVPCRVSTARNELRGQQAACQQFLTPPLEFPDPPVSYLRSHFPPWQLCARGNLYLLSQVHFLQIHMFESHFLQESECDLLVKLPGLLGSPDLHSGLQINFPRKTGDSPLSFPCPQ